jgi:hypothetical protein
MEHTMSEGKYVDEVHRRLCALDEDKALNDPLGPLGTVINIANDVAKQHPVWYERFRISAGLTRLWRSWK